MLGDADLQVIEEKPLMKEHWRETRSYHEESSRKLDPHFGG